MNSTTSTSDASGPRAVAVAYVEAVGRHDLDTVSDLLAEDATARMAGVESTKPEWLAALGRLLPALERNEIRHASADGDTACIVYDFVTNTPAGAVACVEVVKSSGGRIHGIELIFDRVAFAPVNQVLNERANAATE